MSLDFWGSVFALIATYQFIILSPWGWVTTFIAAFMDIALYYQHGIYGDMALNGLYAISSVYGLLKWLYGSDQGTALPISKISAQHALTLTLIAIIVIPTVAHFLHTWGHSQVAYLDATTTILSILGQWLTCRKIIESWALWFVIDVMSIELYAVKHLPFHTGLFCIYLCCATAGFINWRRQYRRQQQSSDDLNLSFEINRLKNHSGAAESA